MPTLPTSTERTDAALTIARTKAAAYADTGDTAMAYKALLRGVQSAQRVNRSGQTSTTLAGLWAMPAVKAAAVGGAAAITAAVVRAKTKSKPDSEKKSSPDSSAPSTPEADASVPQQGRFRRPGRRKASVSGAGPVATETKGSVL